MFYWSFIYIVPSHKTENPIIIFYYLNNKSQVKSHPPWISQNAMLWSQPVILAGSVLQLLSIPTPGWRRGGDYSFRYLCAVVTYFCIISNFYFAKNFRFNSYLSHNSDIPGPKVDIFNTQACIIITISNNNRIVINNIGFRQTPVTFHKRKVKI